MTMLELQLIAESIAVRPLKQIMSNALQGRSIAGITMEPAFLLAIPVSFDLIYAVNYGICLFETIIKASGIKGL